MGLPSIANCQATIYRNFDPSNIYPDAGAGKIATVPAIIRHHIKAGKFGYQNPKAHWTHLLYVDISTDIRDAYQSQLTAEDFTQADTVTIDNYPTPGRCSAFLVVLIQRDRAGSFLRVYLDRAQPIDGPCIQGVTGCDYNLLPKTWKVTFAGVFNNNCSQCDNFNREWKLEHDIVCFWQSNNIASYCDSRISHPVVLAYDPTFPATWTLEIETSNLVFIRYTLSGDQWQALAANTMTRIYNDPFDCFGFPDTAIVSPA